MTSTVKKLKTYSKVQKVINYSSLFSDMVANTTSPLSSTKHPNSTNPRLNHSESIIETINTNKQTNAGTAGKTAKRRAIQKATSVEMNKENQEVEENEKKPTKKVTKRKNAKATVADRLKQQSEAQKMVKLFEDSDSNSNHSSSNQNAAKPPPPIHINNNQINQISCDSLFSSIDGKKDHQEFSVHSYIFSLFTI
jgi:hypothetical protein